MISFLFAFAFSSINLSPNEEKSFLSWMRNANKLYIGDEYHFRLGIFLSNLKYVHDHNSNPNKKFKLGMNHLSVLTQSEYYSLLGYKSLNSGNLQKSTIKSSYKRSEEIDWRTKGAVTAIKNQGDCASCWAFSTIQNCESAEFLKYNVLYTFSEQSLVDCVTTCQGCEGGYPYLAFEHIINKCDGKVMLQSDYPYTATTETCKYDASKSFGHFTKYIRIESKNEEDLAAKCEQYGPISIGIDSHHLSFNLYSGGIYDEPECIPTFLNHGVGLVGYGSENEVAYWIVKNSFGTEWGESGYIRMIRGTNQCGEATEAVCIISE